MPYSLIEFELAERDNPGYAKALYDARQFMGLMSDAMQSGYSQNIMPLGGLSNDKVKKAVDTIELEWSIEWAKRTETKMYSGGPNFVSLPLLQQHALIEGVKKALNGG